MAAAQPTQPPERAPAGEETIAPATRSKLPAPAARPLTPEDINRATLLLAVSVGPIAAVLARRAARPGITREQFIAELTAYLRDDGERARFVSALD